MTAETLEDWLARQRPSLRTQVAFLGGPDNPAIRPLLERQMHPDAHGRTFADEFSTSMHELRKRGIEAERFARYSERLINAFA